MKRALAGILAGQVAVEEDAECRAEMEAEDRQRRAQEQKKAEEAASVRDLSAKLAKWQEMGLESTEKFNISPPRPYPKKCALLLFSFCPPFL